MCECYFPKKENMVFLSQNIIRIKNTFSKIKTLLKEKFKLRGKYLMTQQIYEEAKRRKEENINYYLDEIEELKENIHKKESFLKQFEKKFFEVEIFVQRESKLSQLERYRKFHYYEILSFINNNEVFQYRKTLLNEEIENIRNDLVKIIDENIILKKNIYNIIGKRKNNKHNYKNYEQTNDDRNRETFLNTNEKNLNYKNIEESYNKKVIFLERKNEHLKAKYHELLKKINNFNSNEFGSLIINYRQTFLNFNDRNIYYDPVNINRNEKNQQNFNALNRKNSLGINFILGGYKNPFDPKTHGENKSNFNESEEYSFIKENNKKSKRKSNKINSKKNQINLNRELNNDLVNQENNSKPNKNSLQMFQVYNTEGNFIFNDEVNKDENFISNKNKWKNNFITEEFLESNKYLNEKLKNNKIKKSFKSFSNKEQINLKSKISELEKPKDIIKRKNLDIPKTFRYREEDNLIYGNKNNKLNNIEDENNLMIKFFEKRNKNNKPIINTKNEIIYQNNIIKDHENVKIQDISRNILDDIDKIDKSCNVNSEFNSENNTCNENVDNKQIVNYNEISFNQNSPIFLKKQSKLLDKKSINNNINLNYGNDVNDKIKIRERISQSYIIDEIDYKNIFKNYNIVYENISISSESDNSSQNNSEIFNNSNFYFDNIEKSKEKKIFIPNLKLSNIKNIDKENNNFDNLKFNKFDDFEFKNDSEDDVELDLEINYEEKKFSQKISKLNFNKKNTLNLSPIIKPRNSDDIWNNRNFEQ